MYLTLLMSLFLIQVEPTVGTVSPVVRLQAVDNSVCASVKTREIAFASCGDAVTQTIVAQLGPSSNLPEPISHPLSDSYRSPIPEPLPQSTYDQFAGARLQRVRDGYGRGSTIDERVGGHQVVGEGIWFGKAFYDGEGISGVGDLGYFDTRSSQFTMFSIKELADWSVSALLVEGDAVWAGLVKYGEGTGGSGPLPYQDGWSYAARIRRTTSLLIQVPKARLICAAIRGQPQVGLRSFISTTARMMSMSGPFGPGLALCLGEKSN
jgi:hypothetical protein